MRNQVTVRDGGGGRAHVPRRTGMLLAVQLFVTGLVLLTVDRTATAFNLETINYILQEGEPNSMFGFSVVLHREQNKSWVIVGAPTANTTQNNVIEGGAVYRCDIYDDHRCFLVPFDTQGNNFNDQNEQIDTKSNQWFGATVASAGIDGPLVACAPRYVFHQLQPRKVERVEPVGTCYLAKKNMQEFHDLSPCRTAYWGYHRQGSCQAGFSAALTKDGSRVFIGAPGSYYWQGQMYSINTDVVFPYKPPRYGHFGEGGQIYSFSLNDPKDKVYKTLEDTKKEDDSYLGYSSTTGDFNGDGTQGVAVGKPRGAQLLGKVLIYSWNMTNQQNITGEQIGAYFGYSLASVDVDGDRLDDLIIGAPMYTEPNNEGKYETGRVYIMYQGSVPSGRFRELDTRDGVNSKARFGLAVCSLGDLNLDGYGDFAVGAPYDGPNGRGAVYIFYGSRTGPLAKASQVIQAEDLSVGTRLSTFGFAVSGGIDLDGNQYPDMVVGAYESDKTFVFKARPVAAMEASTLFGTERKLIALDERNCTVVQTQKLVACTVLHSCLKYKGINVPSMLDIEISWTLDARKPRNPRMFFLDQDSNSNRTLSMRLTRDKLECRSDTVYVADNIRDKITPLEVEMAYRLRQNTQNRQRRPRANVEPVLDHNRGTVQRDTINIQKNCGPDNVCVPDLRMEVKSVDDYLLGSNNLLSVEVLITNRGEDAFEAGFYMAVPNGLDFRRVDRLGEVKDVPVLCTAPSAATKKTLKCDIGNPLSSGKVVHFNVILAPSFSAGMGSSYDFYLETNSTNAEVEGSQHDNVVRKSIGILVQTDLSMSGVSLPEEFLYNYSEYRTLEEARTERDIGPQVVHIYEIRNEGPSTIDEAEFFVLWPYETLDGVPLMYLLNQPETHGNIECLPTEYANPLNLAIDSALARKSFLDKVGVSGTSFSSTMGRTTKFSGVSSSALGSDGAATAGSGGGGASSISFHSTTGSSSGRSGSSSSGGGSSISSSSTSSGGSMSGSSSSTSSSSYSSSSSSSSSSMGSSSGGVNESRYSSSARGSSSAGAEGSNYRLVSGGGSERRYQTEGSDVIATGRVHGEYGQAQGDAYSRQGYGQQGSQQGEAYRRQQQQYEGRTRVTDAGYGAAAGGAASGFDVASSSSSSISGGRNGTSSSVVYYTSKNRTTYRDEDGRVHVSESSEYHRSNSGLGGGQGNLAFEAGATSDAASGSSTRRRMMSQQDGDVTPSRTGLITEFMNLGDYTGSGVGSTASHDLNRLENKFRTEYSQQQVGGGASSYHAGSSSSTSSTSGRHTHYTSREHQHQQVESATYASNAYNGIADDLDHEEDDYDSYDRSEEDSYVDPVHSGASGNRRTYPPGYGLPHLKQHLNQGHENVEQKFRYYQRFDRQRRQAPGKDESDRALEEALRCHATRCAIIHCKAGPIGNKDVAFIALRTRAVAHTFHQLSGSESLYFSTMNVARVLKLPYIGEPKDKPIKTHEIKVLASPERLVKPDVVPLWIVVLAACAGALILLLLIYLLSKCGFFERKRPTDSSERQPLNRNGNYHGDEHL
ncbi:integrin alpha-PS2 isoform X1 [Anopheles stephensi]|uniref:integrin alpha-PS2 isoform X1 n=1 Tax=Anopheles stephensi TaxID=30069 RepID=UPI001658ADCB|nr:integrin alpha-PS2 isoform X1 [Anopheles stephensi]XP_035905039.1 integrin alpha-PS2 isoform X1 [Anopheles stephensi]XP_035905050.1 integrin alpha-PS2 isoform X1 [Anopheles stephensi]XP_035905060.1 integrin alpha-PS2 isoform X1 [Anopheles stephensi]XP_035905067.1 integrin alpha-PS2 isoform X1 [Anopheles stephensi]XP_035905076.1 integrin alpha-PS2 isoform X1 [Anopheles stephensi]XP_035905085.1 integrin alpha-PS2 isoform X1 [Anopheles stephensi]